MRGGVLIVSNHQGNLDPVLLAVRLKRPLNYIAKAELFDNPLAARMLRVVNAFPVRQARGMWGRCADDRAAEGGACVEYFSGGRSVGGWGNWDVV